MFGPRTVPVKIISFIFSRLPIWLKYMIASCLLYLPPPPLSNIFPLFYVDYIKNIAGVSRESGGEQSWGFDARFLNLSNIDILGQITLSCEGLPWPLSIRC